MPIIGFSTGSLAPGDFDKALRLIRRAKLGAVELSAIREEELDPLVRFLRTANLDDFDYVSLHAPSSLARLSEAESVGAFVKIGGPWPVIVHPDVIKDVPVWRILGNRLCIENMDQRKASGRTAAELRPLFEALPDARFCLDLAHASQIDPTMSEARRMLGEFGDRLQQIHISSIDSRSMHGPLNLVAARTFRSVLRGLNTDIPWILEGVVEEDDVAPEVVFASEMIS